MAAFNWIDANATCPVCGEDCSIRIQLHIAASFNSSGDGRFCNKTYRVGDRLEWWSEDHPDFASWFSRGLDFEDGQNSVRECCYAEYGSHDDRLYVVVEVSNLTIAKLIELGPEDDWPSSYPK